MTKKSRMVTVCVYLEPRQLKELRRAREETGKNMSALIRDAVDLVIERVFPRVPVHRNPDIPPKRDPPSLPLFGENT